MKSLSTIPAVAFLLAFSFTGPARAGTRAEIGIVAGYRYLDTDELTSEHDTHPDDGFLLAANRPHSAGTTSVQQSHWLLFGGRLTKARNRSLIAVDLGLLLGSEKSNFERRQNINDLRPFTEASFIYSQAEYGIGSSVSFSHEVRRIQLGVEGQVNGIYLERGWERFGKRQKEDTEIVMLFSLGPKIGVTIGDSGTIELSLQSGNATVAQMSFSATF